MASFTIAVEDRTVGLGVQAVPPLRSDSEAPTQFMLPIEQYIVALHFSMVVLEQLFILVFFWSK